MRTPWVSRHTAEIWERSSNGWAKQCDGLLEALNRKDDRYDRLMERYHSSFIQREELSAALREVRSYVSADTRRRKGKDE